MAASNPTDDYAGAAVLRALGRCSRDLLARAAESTGSQHGDLLFEEGTRGIDLFVVQDGEVEVFVTTAAGPQPLSRLSAGDLVGEIAHLDGGPRSATARSLTPGRVCRLDGPQLAAARREDPDLEIAMLRLFCRSVSGKIRQAHVNLMEIISLDGEAPTPRAGVAGSPLSADEEHVRRILDTHGLGSDGLRPLARLIEPRTFCAGDAIFSEGEPGGTLCIVADGKVRISRRVPGAGEEAVAVLGPGEVFGEMAWLDSGPRSADAVAHTGGCEVLMIDRRELDRTLEARPGTGVELLRVLAGFLCRRVRAMCHQLVAYRTMAAF